MVLENLTERQETIAAHRCARICPDGPTGRQYGHCPKYDLGVSPATIRNDLAALEREGLLMHPHTSAGRSTDR